MKPSKNVLLVWTQSQLTDTWCTSGWVGLEECNLPHVAYKSLSEADLKNLNRAGYWVVPDNQVSSITAELKIGSLRRANTEAVKTIPRPTRTLCVVKSDNITTVIFSSIDK